MVGDDHQRPGPEVGVHAAGGIREDDDLRAEPPHQEDGLDNEAGVVALVQVKAPLEHHHRRSGQVTEQEPAGVTGGRRRRPAWQLLERDRDGVCQFVGEAAQA